MKYKFIFLFFIIFLTLFSLLGKSGSCEDYAVLVCDICGQKSEICIEVTKKAADHPEDEACKTGLRLLPSVYKESTDEDKAKIRKVLCEKKI